MILRLGLPLSLSLSLSLDQVKWFAISASIWPIMFVHKFLRYLNRNRSFIAVEKRDR